MTDHLVGGISSAARGLPSFDGKSFRVEKARGAWLTDQVGERYLDTALGFGATMLGHAHDVVNEAVLRAIADGSMPAFSHHREEEAAAALTVNTGRLSQAVFVNTGSEAVHLACRIARAKTGRRHIVKFAAGYDGWYDEVAFGNTGSDAASMKGQRPQQGELSLLRFGDIEDAEALFAERGDIAAILIEPVLANAGCLVADPGYLQKLGEIAHRHGALVILDEVLMGFRLQCGLAGHLSGITADLAAVGKAIASGFAVAAVIGTPSAMEVFDRPGAVRAGTYNGNPVACAAVTATMACLQTLDYAALIEAGDAVREHAASAFREAGLPVCTSGYGNVFTFWRGAKPPVTYEQALAQLDAEFVRAMHFALRRQRVISMPILYGRHYLCAAHGPNEIAFLKQALSRAAAEAADVLLERS